MIRTDRLDLIPATAAHFAVLKRSEAAFAASLHVTLARDWLGFEAAREALVTAGDYLDSHPEAALWWTYWFVLRDEGVLVGMGGYRGAPKDGEVEIGYALAPDFLGRGLATEAARALLNNAFDDPRVTRIVAHTLPEKNASTRVLERLGFEWSSSLVDPTDGEIWRWVLGR
jgi:RimJ/RimL family protein N-acetyltransferase